MVIRRVVLKMVFCYTKLEIRKYQRWSKSYAMWHWKTQKNSKFWLKWRGPLVAIFDQPYIVVVHFECQPVTDNDCHGTIVKDRDWQQKPSTSKFGPFLNLNMLSTIFGCQPLPDIIKIVAMTRETYTNSPPLNLGQFSTLTWHLPSWMAIIARNWNLLNTAQNRDAPNRAPKVKFFTLDIQNIKVLFKS